MAQEIKMSAAGLKAMQEELEYLKTVRRKELAEEIKEARSHGDLSENSEYDEAKNTQGLVENCITELEQMVKNAVVIDESELSVENVSVGTHVTIQMDGEDEKADTARAKEILNSLDLLDKVKLHPMSLSGGEKQRVAIGSAIASDKKILIFDEPTSGLDYRHMLEVSDNLNRLKEMGKSLFLITHDPELIYKCCTYLLFIQGSKVLWHRPMDGEAVKLLRAFFSHEQETGAVNAS